MILLDTHVLIWAVNGDRRLGAKVAAVIDDAQRSGRIGVSAITPWEVAMLVQKGRLRLALDVGAWLEKALGTEGVDVLPIEPAIAVDSVRLPGSFHADPADRFIVATARHWQVRLATADRAILDYAAEGHLSAVDASQ